MRTFIHARIALICVLCLAADTVVSAQNFPPIKTNTRKGNITIELYTPQKFIQCGGTTTTLQNNLDSRGILKMITEYDSYSHVNYTYRSTRLSPMTTLNFSQGISLARKKGGIPGFGGVDAPHFGLGMTTVGYLSGVEYERLFYKRLYVYASMDLSAGVSFSDFGDETSSDWSLLNINVRQYHRLANRGFGATVQTEAGLKFIPCIGRINDNEVFQVNISYSLTAHGFWLLPFYINGATYSNISAVYIGGQNNRGLVTVGMSFDLLKNK